MTDTDKPTVLITDDAAANVQLLSLIMKEQGYNVRGLRKGAMVLPSALQSKPDIILLDIMMPDIDGYEVCRQLKENENTQDIPVIFISALNQTIDKVKAFSSGGVDFVTKPVQKEEVLARIKTHLDLSSLRKELELKNQWLQHEIQGRKKIEKSMILDDRRLKALLALTQMAKQTEKEMAEYALDKVIHLTESTIGYFHMVSEDQNTIILTAWSQKALESCSMVNAEHHSIEEAGIWADCVRQRKTVIHNDFPQQHELPKGHTPIHRHMSIPIFDGKAIVAVSGVGNKPEPYNDSDKFQLTLFMNSLWEIIKRKRTEEALTKANMELSRLASMDGLTRIANRRRFDEYLENEWGRQARDKKPLSLIMCDIDYFKQYNDTYGHQSGDETLCRIAEALSAVTRRSSDLAARYGGEEFVIVLPGTDEHGAMAVAKQLMEHVRGLNIPHEKSAAAPYVSVSIGVATIDPPSHETRCETLIAKADQALYNAKGKGRNTVVFNP